MSPEADQKPPKRRRRRRRPSTWWERCRLVYARLSRIVNNPLTKVAVLFVLMKVNATTFDMTEGKTILAMAALEALGFRRHKPGG